MTTGRMTGPAPATPQHRCPRTNKPVEFCCVGNPWQDNRALYYGEPLPQIVIDVAAENRLEPHMLMDDVTERGWETHDRGFDEQVRLGAVRIDEDRWWASVGALVASRRRASGLTQDELALSVGMVRSSIANLEAGRQHVSAWTLTRIACLLGLSLCHLTPCEHRRQKEVPT